MKTEPARFGSNSRAILGLAAVFIFLFAEAVIFQHLGGALTSDYGGFPDEAAHYVTSIMVKDFLVAGDLSDPMGFARDFYLSYPKVALGHWPPVFYGLLGLWFVLFGSSRVAAMAFIAATAAATGTAIYRIGARELHPAAGWLAATLFIAIPLTQRSTGMVMLEHLVTFFTLLSAMALARLFAAPTVRNGLLFGCLATLAIMTRGSAWSIALMPGIAMLIIWRFDLIVTRALWVSAIPVLVLCVPWYVATRGMSEGAWAGAGLGLEFAMNAIPKFLQFIFVALGPVLVVLALLGAWSKLRVSSVRKEAAGAVWAAMAAMIIATYGIHVVIPAAVDPRYMLPTLPGLLLLSVAGIEWTVRRVRFSVSLVTVRASLYVSAIIGFGILSFNVQEIANGGYAQAVRSVANAFHDSPAVLLIDSSSAGEGSVVAAAANLANKNMIVLRGSKVLVQEDWLGRNSREKFGSPNELAKVLDQVPVGVVVLDDSIVDASPRAHRAMLRAALDYGNSSWTELARFPVFRSGKEAPGRLRVLVSDAIGSSEARQPLDKDLIRKLNSRD